MFQDIKRILETEIIEASAPCRIDMGGTVDIRTFYLPLRHLLPCTFNMALDLRTRVRLLPYRKGFIKISSTGFESAEYALDRIPFDHPLGLMLNIAAYFRIHGICIDIESKSPPRSALGGSSAAAIALIAALSKLAVHAGSEERYSRAKMARLAFALEESVAGVPCGFQDHLAAAYGGVNAWHWQDGIIRPAFRRQVVVYKKAHKVLEKQLLLAYCGKPHKSRDVNGIWVKQFLNGQHRDLWAKIILYTQKFIEAVCQRDFRKASQLMHQETDIRRNMTPEVLDDVGKNLVSAARACDCGARFTGAGGGGCIWALGEIESIDRLRLVWEEILATNKDACLLQVKIDSRGLIVH
jgi:D-glycero-alpha-D-manno-heptose-7-phosphate kinase